MENNKFKCKNIFVTIGVEFSRIPMANKIRMLIWDGESEIKIVKRLRKQFADNPENHGWSKGTKFIPSQLFYAIFDSFEDKTPRITSENFVTDYIDSCIQELVRQ